MRHWRLTLRLHASPGGLPTLADVRTPPLRVAEDYEALYAALSEMACQQRNPVLLGYAQFYRTLAGVAEAARGLALDAPLLIEVARPIGVPLPASLLTADVLLADRVDSELQFWRRHAMRGVLALRARLVREPYDYGDNTLSFELHSRRHECNPLPQLVAACAGGSAWRSVDAGGAARAAPAVTRSSFPLSSVPLP